jgi:excisionase family DNA binding protein
MHRRSTGAVPRSRARSIPAVPPRQPANADPLPRVSYSIPEAARAMGLSESTVKRLIESGQLASKKVLRRRLIPVKAIDAFLSNEAI